MEYFKELTSDSAVHEYLKDFPENDWKLVIKKTLLYGIHSLKALENLGLASPKLEKIPALHSEIAELKKNVEEEALNNQNFDIKDKSRRENKEISRTINKPRGTSQKQVRDRGKPVNSAALRGSSKDLMKQPPFKLTGKERPEVPRKLPKYLQNIDSKIKEDVLKSRKGNFRGDRSERSDRKEDRPEKEIKYEKNFRDDRERFEWNEKNRGEREKVEWNEKNRGEKEKVEWNEKNRGEKEKVEWNEKNRGEKEKVEWNEKNRGEKEKFEWNEKNRGEKEKFERNEKNRGEKEKFERNEKNDDKGFRVERQEKNEKKDRIERNFEGKTDKKEKNLQGKWEEWKNVDLSKQKSLDSNEESPRSSSSFSTYHAADEVKEFYQKEFSKLMPFGSNQKW